MASQQFHLSSSIFLGAGYAALGLSAFKIHPEFVLLASVTFVVAGILPNIDADPGSGQARELGGLLTAAAPLVLLYFFPFIRAGGMPRIALVVICSYLLSRFIFVRFFEHWTKHRGMIHSVPAAIITGQLVFLLFWDLFLRERMYLAGAAFFGFLSHLVIDAYGNIDIAGVQEKKSPALKFAGRSAGSTFALYACVMLLGWLILRDVYPGLALRTRY